uniref:NADH-ubiquinone oxidoreductase chain 3 n=1 Tax=Fer nigripennis TaxID=2778953 RepID=A0A7M3V5H5_9ORTH|nr:NADH dehydrogenase subunit 3 [Fer nigripennis]QON98901.1 NADH dehydrogenase subunit 3 [Fer nigripennis]
MLTTFMSTFISITMPMIIMMLASMMSNKMNKEREKSSPFECGFDPKSSARIPFSLQFFLIAMIFLIFDVEIILILPIIIITKTSNMFIWLASAMYFIIVLLSGLYYEWHQGALKWAE